MTIIRYFWYGIMIAAIAHCGEAGSCSNLTEETKRELVRLAMFQYKLSIPLTVEAESQPDCFIRVRLRSASPEEGFRKVFLVSPDQRYVMKDLVDLRQDPELAARRRNEEFIRQLAPNGAPIRGDANAAVTVVVFSDFQCPYCKRAAELINAELSSARRQTRLVFRQFPLPMHNWATLAAEASVCISRQRMELFWIAHDFLFEYQNALSPSNVITRLENRLRAYREFDVAAFRKCIESGSGKEAVQMDIDFGLENEIFGTPTVFINGVRVKWAGNADQLRSFISQASIAMQAGARQ